MIDNCASCGYIIDMAACDECAKAVHDSPDCLLMCKECNGYFCESHVDIGRHAECTAFYED